MLTVTIVTLFPTWSSRLGAKPRRRLHVGGAHAAVPSLHRHMPGQGSDKPALVSLYKGTQIVRPARWFRWRATCTGMTRGRGGCHQVRRRLRNLDDCTLISVRTRRFAPAIIAATKGRPREDLRLAVITLRSSAPSSDNTIAVQPASVATMLGKVEMPR